MREDFDITTTLLDGLLPKVYTSDNPKKYLASYIQAYLKEEVLQEGLTRNIATFSRFLEVASFSQGSTLNYSNIAKEASVSRFVVTNYFSILEDLLLSIHLTPFTRRAKRRLITQPKFYYFDNGVYQYLRPSGPLDTPREIEGASLETIFLQHLCAINDYYNLNYSIYYWRTSCGTEVDFVLYGKHGLHAFEIKRTGTITNKMMRGLHSFKKDYEMAKTYLIFGGKHREYHGDIQVIPFIEALQTLPIILGS